jgi:hypothetical protein
VCTIKQHVWTRFQRPLLERRAQAEHGRYAGAGLGLVATIAFDSFSSHPMWREADQRANLTIKKAAGTCGRVLKRATPLRSKERVRDWAALADAAERRAAAGAAKAAGSAARS